MNMLRQTRLMSAVLCSALAATLMSGCLRINAPREPSSVEVREPGQQNAPAAPDDRPPGVIASENARLRSRLATLENEYAAVKAARDAREDQISQLKRERDQLKKDRDRWKKAAKGDD